LGRPGRVIVIGGGVIGTMHALSALERGFEVLHIEREVAPRGASVRNFGLVWVGGRAAGEELALALRARVLWEEMAERAPGLDFRPAGSLTVATDDVELALMKEAARQPDAGLRQWEVLDGAGAAEANAEISPGVAGALYCGADGIVEPRLAVHALRAYMAQHASYQWLGGRAVVELGERSLRDDTGAWHQGDRVFLCPGANFPGLLAQYAAARYGPAHEGGLPIRRVRLQMLETEAYPGEVTTAVADGDSMRYYPAFDLPARSGLGPQAEVAAASAAQLLLVQRLDGSLTIGDTHDYDEPFPFDAEEEIYSYLLAKAASILRRPLPPVRRRWAGVYCEVKDKSSHLYWREELLSGVVVVNGPGGRGMTCAPAIAEASMEAFA
jgi:FAD dependent oxidoreductase TIGR03364